MLSQRPTRCLVTHLRSPSLPLVRAAVSKEVVQGVLLVQDFKEKSKHNFLDLLNGEALGRELDGRPYHKGIALGHELHPVDLASSGPLGSGDEGDKPIAVNVPATAKELKLSRTHYFVMQGK